jgi:hypothetical protein
MLKSHAVVVLDPFVGRCSKCTARSIDILRSYGYVMGSRVYVRR